MKLSNCFSILLTMNLISGLQLLPPENSISIEKDIGELPLAIQGLPSEVYISKPNDMHDFTDLFKDRKLSQKSRQKKSNKLVKVQKSVSRKMTLTQTMPLKNLNLRGLMELIQKTTPKLYQKMSSMSNRQKIRFLQSTDASFWKKSKPFLLATGGFIAMKMIIDRIAQHIEFSDLKHLAENKITGLINSRTQKRRELSELQNSIVELENRLESLTESTSSKVTELDGWIDTHRF